ncbi:MAG: toxin [Balneolaceae bacterium]|nr:MAG: toxin [Balneolaceae bacterium]
MNNATKQKVKAFLKRLKSKATVFQIIYLDNRSKNAETLGKLDITPNERDQIIQSLAVQDYYRGPKHEAFHGGDSEMWEFGKHVNEEEVYIKVTLGQLSRPVICISFHIAERPIIYPFK